ncbi:unnamed protein product [Blepharisma stoltei]|uniref:Sm domain-containing protein n=1 Tax=Blepharisma stoltei TaxID=1481888 RepID=A0AAU9KB35_9CILI|nr:unnamed protein product [Blepharisma stoltei]
MEMESATQAISSLNIEEDEELSWIQHKVLNNTLRITLTDTRKIQGKLQCLDHLGNIVLTEAVEHIPNFNIQRNVGSVIIPSKAIEKIELENID